MSDNVFQDYKSRLVDSLQYLNWSVISRLAEEILLAYNDGRHIFLCGNGGSAANAMHIANDFLCLWARGGRPGVKVTALSDNQAILTCLANDIGYENIFSFQLKVLGKKEDVLVVLSGSGNSMNILKAVKTAKEIGISTYAILGFDGGECLSLVDAAVHFPVNDMQISEDLQLVVGHMLMQWLNKSMLSERDA